MWFLLFFVCVASATVPDPSKPVVVFVHGMFMTPRSWDEWRGFFEDRGYETIAPAWPGHDGDPTDSREHPDPILRTLTLGEVTDVYRQAIDDLDGREVVLVGHSMGGLVVQLLLQDGTAKAGVAIDSAPPKGVSTTKFSFIRSNIAVFQPGNAPIRPSERWFRYAFAHTLPQEEADAVFRTEVVPESRRVGRGPTTKAARIDFRAMRPPLLLIAGDEDHIIPARLVDKNARAYRHSPAVTDILHFPGRVHWIVGQAGWEEVASATVDWLEKNRREEVSQRSTM